MIRLINKRESNKIRFDSIPIGTIFGFHNVVLVKIGNFIEDKMNRNCVLLSVDYESDDKFLGSLNCGDLVHFAPNVEIERNKICQPWSTDVEIRF